CCVILLFLTPRRPPPSTLFPYTTLFRSHPHCPGARRRAGRRSRLRSSPRTPVVGLPRRDGIGAEGARRSRSRVLGRAGWSSFSTDRKSTRLNSSHVAISYAVFCLKKKKI